MTGSLPGREVPEPADAMAVPQTGVMGPRRSLQLAPLRLGVPPREPAAPRGKPQQERAQGKEPEQVRTATGA
jgi:hypothetical protein